MAEYQVKARIDLRALIDGLHRAVLRSYDIVAFGLQAADTAPVGELQLPGAFFHMGDPNSPDRTWETAKAAFKTWVLGAGLRDCVEAVGALLEEGRKVCAFWSFGPGRVQVTGEEWNRRVVQGARRFHRLGLPDKIETLKKTYDPSIAPATTEHVLSINAARNCLVHRGGVVTDLDVTTPEGQAKGLMVRWVKMQLLFIDEDGERPINGPVDVKKGQRIGVRSAAEASKFFPLGEAVTFTTQEFSELAYTFSLFGQQLAVNLEQYGRSKGVRFETPAEAAPRAAL
jgi:hypothetical protein